MKKPLIRSLFATFAVLLLTAGTLCAQQKEMVRLTRFEGVPFAAVSASFLFNVEIYPSDRNSATVELPADMEDRLRFEVTPGGVLTIGLDNSGRSRVNIKGNESRYYRAKVYIRDLTSLDVSGGADVALKGRFETASFQLACGGTSDVEGLDLVVRNNARIRVTGGADASGVIRAGSLDCEVGGTADLDLDADAGRIKYTVTGGADVSGVIRAGSFDCQAGGTADLDLDVTAGGQVKYAVSGGADISGMVRAGSSFDCQAAGTADVRLDIDAPEVNCTAVGGVSADLKLTAQRVQCSAAGTSKIDLDLRQRLTALAAEVSGGAVIEVGGVTDRAELKAFGTGSVKASGLNARHARINALSAGSVHVGDIDEMELTASRGAKIRYANVGTMKSLDTDGASVSRQSR